MAVRYSPRMADAPQVYELFNRARVSGVRVPCALQ